MYYYCDIVSKYKRLNMKILVIDDSITARMLLVNEIKKVEPKAIFYEASDGAIGLEIFKKEKPRVVFTDLTMPNMDGYEALEKIMEIDSNTQVIVVSADSQPKAEKTIKKLGAKNLYIKPINEKVMQNIFSNDLLI